MTYVRVRSFVHPISLLLKTSEWPLVKLALEPLHEQKENLPQDKAEPGNTSELLLGIPHELRAVVVADDVEEKSFWS